jgi:hypothetical protein
MPRGSEPGERRGGRQKGTPNKKTVLRNAAIDAAAANPNLSPLDFLLGLMRNPSLPSDLRTKMAEVAAPFVHRKPTKDNPRILASRKHVALMKAVHKGKAAQPGGADPNAGKPGTLAVEGAAEDETPLEYLMGVMRDPDIKPELRIRIAQRVVPFVHPKQKQDRKADQTEAELADALGDEFLVDPELAAKIRDDELRLKELPYSLVCRGSRAPPAPAELEAKAALEARIEEAATAIGCPPGYGSKEQRIDYAVADRVSKKRTLVAPHNRLTRLQWLLEAQAVARLAAYARTPEQRAKRQAEERLDYLRRRLHEAGVAEREEYIRLRALYPDFQERYPDPDAPPPPEPPWARRAKRESA